MVGIDLCLAYFYKRLSFLRNTVLYIFESAWSLSVHYYWNFFYRSPATSSQKGRQKLESKISEGHQVVWFKCKLFWVHSKFQVFCVQNKIPTIHQKMEIFEVTLFWMLHIDRNIFLNLPFRVFFF